LRVGKTIDRYERKYFGLFPQMTDFLGAEIFMSGDGWDRIKVIRNPSNCLRDTTFILRPATVQALRYLINDYEAVIQGKQQIRWPLLVPHLVRMPHFQKYHIEECSFDCDEESLKGQILAASDTMLVVWRSNSFYDWRQLNAFLSLLPVDELERIVVVHKGHTWKGIEYGALIGAGSGAVAGFMSGDDKSGYIQFTAGQKALSLGSALGFVGAMSGGIIGGFKDKDEIYVIGRKREKLQRILPALKKSAVFPHLIPPELIAAARLQKDGKLSFLQK